MSFQDYATIKFGTDSSSLIERAISGKLPFSEAGKAVVSTVAMVMIVSELGVFCYTTGGETVLLGSPV